MPKAYERLVALIVQLGGWALLGAALLVTYDVITRKLLNISIAGADEISGYVFAVATACAFSYVLVSRANIRIDLVYNLLPVKARRVLDLVAIAATAGYFLVLTWFAWGLVADAFRYGSRAITPLQTPLALPQTAWFAGLALATFTAWALTVMVLWKLLRGRWDEVEKIAGVPSITEEIEKELGADGKPGNNGGGV